MDPSTVVDGSVHTDALSESGSSERILIGIPPNHWLYDASTITFDLSRPSPPQFPTPLPSASISLTTETQNVLVAPSKTALIIIDMQNFFLSTFLGRPADSAGTKAASRLLDTAIPAARKAGMQIVWLNWGLLNSELEEAPPSLLRGFGFVTPSDRVSLNEAHLSTDGLDSHEAKFKCPKQEKDRDLTNSPKKGKPAKQRDGLGSKIGPIEIENGKIIDAGRVLMRDSWNAALLPSLDVAYQEGLKLDINPDVWIHKNRLSGLWEQSTPCTNFLEERGIKSLFFAGVNTDQCVLGSLQDAFNKGWDCILLKDACGTTSPDFAIDCVEYNCARHLGFVAECSALEKAVDNMLNAQ